MSDALSIPSWILSNAKPMAGDWLETRKQGISGTEISAIVGLNPWSSSYDVWLDKTGQSEPFEPNEAMEWGTILEPLIAQKLCDKTGKRFILNGPQCWQDMKHELRVCTPDGFFEDPEAGEIKTASAYVRNKWGDPGSDDIPDQYFIQCQWNLATIGAEVMHVPVLFGGQNLLLYRVEADKDFQDMLYESALGWWEHHIIKGNEPEMIWSPSVDQWLKSHFSHRNHVMIPASVQAIESGMRLNEIDDEIKALEEEANNLKAFVQKEIGDNDGVEWGKGKTRSKMTWKKSKDGTSTSWKAVVEHCKANGLVPTDEIISENTVEKPGSRSFRKNIKTNE